MEDLIANIVSLRRSPPAGMQPARPVNNLRGPAVRTVFAHWSDALFKRVRGSRPRAARALQAARLELAWAQAYYVRRLRDRYWWLPIGLSLVTVAVCASLVRAWRALKPVPIRDEAVGVVFGEKGGRRVVLDVTRGANFPAIATQGLRGELVWCPQLVAHLQLVALFRRRDRELLQMLRNRAIVWCREHEVSDTDASVFVAGSVARAFAIGSAEAAAMEALRSHDVGHAIAQTAALHGTRPFTGYRTGLMDWLRGDCSMGDVLAAWRHQLFVPALTIPGG